MLIVGSLLSQAKNFRQIIVTYTRWTRMKCKQGVSGVLGGVNLAKHSQTVSFVLCYTKKTDSFGECGSNNTPQHPNTPFEKKFLLPGGPPNKMDFF